VIDPLITSAASEVGNRAVEVLKKESESFLTATLGQPAKALGGLLADRINARRHRNLITITVEAKRRLADAGVSPSEVPLSIIHPALESASLEENPDLQAKWANLLANAADARQRQDKRGIHVSVLKELSAPEVRFLDTLYDYVIERILRGIRPGAAHGLGWEVEMDFILKQSHDEGYFDISFIDNLERLNLIRRSTEQKLLMNMESVKVPGTIEETSFYFTELAFGLVEACRPPAKDM
jgi:hypothetical protein